MPVHVLSSRIETLDTIDIRQQFGLPKNTQFLIASGSQELVRLSHQHASDIRGVYWIMPGHHRWSSAYLEDTSRIGSSSYALAFRLRLPEIEDALTPFEVEARFDRFRPGKGEEVFFFNNVPTSKTLREVCSRLGVLPKAVYAYFEDTWVQCLENFCFSIVYGVHCPMALAYVFERRPVEAINVPPPVADPHWQSVADALRKSLCNP